MFITDNFIKGYIVMGCISLATIRN